MRRHAVGNGASTCVLCGEKFGLLASSKLKCKDCHKAVCHKCVVDTSSTAGEQWLLCKICAETREVWKKSGAWFFKGMPRYVMPDPKRPPLANGAGSRRRAASAENPGSPSGSTRSARYSWAKHVQNSANGSVPLELDSRFYESLDGPLLVRRSGPPLVRRSGPLAVRRLAERSAVTDSPLLLSVRAACATRRRRGPSGGAVSSSLLAVVLQSEPVPVLEPLPAELD
ncbi:Rab effector Noc2 [Amphibalanus amphitrite]|uniref:Rab effector Noc2 n=1 Tax=Amphibalanus amphitrite TaxID=1232801 RepID=A0A6A4WXK8_AMPAM|nr:Rab effector Noc2 [Amphibalanus amphitrite]